ncbi:MAG: type II toxin-antitoxin system RelE/ParE family toxin [Chitinophagaceae bacterium]
MNFRIEYHETVESEVREILDWYKEKSSSASFNFLSQLNLTEKAIANNPLAYQIVSKLGIRRAILRKFPYKVYFSIDAPIVYILAIIHFTRSNHYVQKRLKK